MTEQRTEGNGRGRAASHLEQADTGLETRNNGLSEKLDLGIRFVVLFVGRGAAALGRFHRVEGDCVQSNIALRKASWMSDEKDDARLWDIDYRCYRSCARGQGTSSACRNEPSQSQELGRLLALVASAKGIGPEAGRPSRRD